MTDVTLPTQNRWSIALGDLIGYPEERPLTDPLLFSATTQASADQDVRLAHLAADQRKDIVHLVFKPGQRTPTVVLYILKTNTVGVADDVRLFAADGASPIVFTTPEGCWAIDERCRLSAIEPPPLADRDAGEAIALRRLRDRVAQLEAAASPSSSPRPGNRATHAKSNAGGGLHV